MPLLGRIWLDPVRILQLWLQSDLGGLAPAGNDGLWVDPHVDELLRLPDELRGEHCHARRSVTHLVILRMQVSEIITCKQLQPVFRIRILPFIV